MRRAPKQSGFTYLAALFLIAMMGAGLASLGVVRQTAQQRDKERELLFIGAQFRQAIQIYYEKTPGVAKQFPKTLNDMLKDQRYLSTQRYLRKIYIDPMTGKAEWGIVKAVGGGIKGVYSLSSAPAIKVGNFTLANRDFEGKSSIADWHFTYEPKAAQTVAPAGVTTPPNASASAGAPPVAGTPLPGSPGAALPQGNGPEGLKSKGIIPTEPNGFALPPPEVPAHGS